MAQTDDKTSPEGKKWQKTPRSCLLSSFIPRPWIPAGVIPSQARNVLLWLWDLYHVAMPWCDKLTCPGERSVWRLALEACKSKFQGGFDKLAEQWGRCKDWKWKWPGNVQIHHHWYATFLLIKTQMSIYLEKTMWWSNMTYKAAATLPCRIPATSPWSNDASEQQDSWDSSDHDCPPIASLRSD